MWFLDTLRPVHIRQQIVAENGNKLLPEAATIENGNDYCCCCNNYCCCRFRQQSCRFRQQFVAVFGNFVARCGQAFRICFTKFRFTVNYILRESVAAIIPPSLC